MQVDKYGSFVHIFPPFPFPALPIILIFIASPALYPRICLHERAYMPWGQFLRPLLPARKHGSYTTQAIAPESGYNFPIFLHHFWTSLCLKFQVLCCRNPSLCLTYAQ